MAQYTEYENEYLEIGDGSITFRVGSRDGYYVIDVTLTATGFNGTENIDWENLSAIEKDINGTNKFRHGVRDGSWVIDNELDTVLGFSGVENVDWMNINMIN